MAAYTSDLAEAAGGPELVGHRFDAFISFRGEDTRGNFISHLYHALSDAGICTFKDDMELWEGDGIQPELIRAIWSSKVSVVVFSSNYADSRWCLDELVEIMKCREAEGQLVIPVFYDVDPSYINHQTGPLAYQFHEHDNRFDAEKVREWREALRAAANLKGLMLSEHSGDEALLIKNLVRWIENLQKDLKYQEVAQFPVGIQLEASSPPETAPVPHILEYDVFLCYRGADTRKTFTSHLYHGLKDAGVNAFMDSDTLPLGEDIGPGLLGAIRSSKISVVVFSRDFADSRWCLHELVEVMEWRKALGQIVIPVFYHVDPSDIRRQRGPFGEAFIMHEENYSPEHVARWRTALEAAGNLSGYVLDSSSCDEALTVEKIVRQVSITLNDKIYLPLTTFPVGLHSRVMNINSLISAESRGVRFIGILGMGGIGKTTLAKAIYNRFLHRFEAKCFLADVRTNSERPADLVHLQEQLLHDVLRFKRHQISIRNVDEGISIIKGRLRGQKVLLVLDDVSDAEQVRKLVGNHELLGSGSRIIITTRYQDVLDKINVDRDSTYPVQQLDDDESLKLFCSNAFGGCNPEEGFLKQSKEIIKYTQGLPLALELLGRTLSGRTENEWSDTIEELKKIPNHDLQSKLRISYDALGNDDRVKKLFLDIACYFVGYDKDYAVRILKACGLFPEKGIGILTGRCLVEVDDNNKLKMHDLLRDMGRGIARGKSLDDPGKRSHLCISEDILSTLRNHTGTREIEGIAMELGSDNVEKVSAKAFEPMTRLKLLKLDNVQVDGNYQHISKDLRWLCWHHFSLKFIPNEFYLGELVAMDMQYSNLIEVWKGNKQQFLQNLKFLNLSHSHFLTKTPDFLKLPNLEELILEDCLELTEVHPSIGVLKRLDVASFKGCTKLKSFPEFVTSEQSLHIINISGCLKISKLPDDIGQMGSLAKLLADGTAIAHLPSSIAQLKNLTDLALCGCKKTETSFGFLFRSSIPPGPVGATDLGLKNLVNDVVTLAGPQGNMWDFGAQNAGNSYLINAIGNHAFGDGGGNVTHSMEAPVPGNTLGIVHVERTLPGNAQLFDKPGLLNIGSKNMLISSLSGLSSLRVLKLMDCDLSDDMIPNDIGSLVTLEDLDLRKNKLCSLPETMCHLTQLKRLQLDDCINLESVPDMPSSLFSLSAVNCVSLNRISALEFKPGIRLFLTNCHELRTVSGLHMQEPDGCVHLEQCISLTEEFKGFLFKDWCGHGRGEAFLPGTEIPEWFDCRTRDSSLAFQVPPYHGSKLKGFTVCIIYAPNTGNEELRPYPCFSVEPSHFSFTSVTYANIAITPQPHMWVFFIPYYVVNSQNRSLDEVKVSANFGDGWNVKGIGVYIVKDAIPCLSDHIGDSA